MILGVDVHAGYGAISWDRVAAAGVRFSIAKCTEGNQGKDGRFDANVAGARAQGIYVGAYLFAFPLPTDAGHPGRSPKDQARKFYADSKGLGKGYGELPPVLDFEWPPSHEKEKGTSRIIDTWAKWGVSPKFICDWAEECIDEMERLWERTPMIYTYPWFAKSLGDQLKRERFARCPLWLAEGSNLDKWLPPESWEPKVPAPWTRATFVQHGFDGSTIQIPGIKAVPVDRDCFMGDIDELRAIAQIDPDAPTQPELPNPPSEPTIEVDVPSFRPDPLQSVIIHPKVHLGRPALDDDDEPPDDAA